MDKRQARIEALWLTIGALDNLHPYDFLKDEYSSEDNEQVKAALLLIAKELAEEADELGDRQDGWA